MVRGLNTLEGGWSTKQCGFGFIESEPGLMMSEWTLSGWDLACLGPLGGSDWVLWGGWR